MSQKKWSSAMKLKVALSALKGDSTINEVCEKYGVAPCQVHAWKKMLLEEGSQLFDKPKKVKKKKAHDGKNREQQLYEKIGQLTVERDFLKKSWEKLQGNFDED